jgi:hypothetical protein
MADPARREKITMEIPELTAFQMKAIEETVKSVCQTYMLMRPNRTDDLERITRWTNNNNQADQLVNLGLFDNISDDFRQQIQNSMQQEGREFRVFRITPLGTVLFHASQSKLVH